MPSLGIGELHILSAQLREAIQDLEEEGYKITWFATTPHYQVEAKNVVLLIQKGDEDGFEVPLTH